MTAKDIEERIFREGSLPTAEERVLIGMLKEAEGKSACGPWKPWPTSENLRPDFYLCEMENTKRTPDSNPWTFFHNVLWLATTFQSPPGWKVVRFAEIRGRI